MSIELNFPYSLVTFWIRDGERESSFHTIVTRKESQLTDLELIRNHVCNNAILDEGGQYWVYGMEALCKVMSKQTMTRKSKELFNSYGVY